MEKGSKIIIVGCPAGKDWLENYHDIEYASLLENSLKEAGINDIPVVVVPEPRAAMIKLQYDSGRELDLTNGIMLFDFGSSTLDWSFLKSENDPPETASEALGGSLIEENMLASFYDDTHCSGQLAYPDFALADLRTTKERFYISPEGKHYATIEFVGYEPESKTITPAFMTGITHEQKIAIFSDLGYYIEGSWASLCEGFMSRIAHNYEFRNRSPFEGVIILTGGVSRMPFVRDICMALFPEAVVKCDGEPSYSVSRGLALYPNYERSDLEKGVTAYKRGNYEEAVKWYQKSADQGDASAQNKLGECYYYGHGVSQSYVNAAKWYRKSADQGYAFAQFSLGYCYKTGYGVSQSYVDAVKWYQKSAIQGNSFAQYNLGNCYYFGHGVFQSYVDAVKWYQKSADQGNASAQYNLGYCYEKGHGVSQSYVDAVKWYQESANQGDASAQNQLGECYYYGRGVSQSYVDAVKWYRKSADQGNESAKNNLDYCYKQGYGVFQSVDTVKRYRMSADQGDAVAQYNLGSCYYYGRGVSQSYVDAVKWYQKSADQGDASAQYNLGYCYEKGYGVSQSRIDAVKWYRKSAYQGYAEAQSRLSRLGYSY